MYDPKTVVDLPAPPHLEACPFCGSALAVVWRKSNPRASCKTPDCWGGKGIAIALDDPQQVAAWNCRKTPNVKLSSGLAPQQPERGGA